MSYYEEYMEEPTPSSISYEDYIEEKRISNNTIEELETKVEDLEIELDDAKKINKTLMEELKKYERIIKQNNITI